ncbi:MAG: TonB-dependent receptor [Longimicrobiales bacterium]|nr:TonB-dependent receptor [Longimicrobiales bacterium]
MRSSLLGGAALTALYLSTSLTPPALLAQQDPVELDSLKVITGTALPRSSDQLGNHVTVLDGDELRARGVTRIEDALRGASGLHLVRNGSFGALTSLFMRGAESDQVQVLLDGVPLNQPGGAIDLSGLTLENVERIEISRGPSSALGGSDAMAGVIQIITRTGVGPISGAANARMGSFGRRDTGLTLDGSAGAARYSVTATRYLTDGTLDLNNEHDQTVVSGRVDITPDERSFIRLSANLSDREFNFPTDGAGNATDRNQFTFTDRTTLAIEARRQFAPWMDVRLLLTSLDEETGTDDAFDDEEDTESFVSLTAIQRLGADLRANLDLPGGSVLTLGGEFEDQDVRDFSEFVSPFGTSTGRSENDRTNLASYLHWTGGIGALSANGGVRLEENDNFGTSASWQAGAAFAVTDRWTLRSAAGRGIKEPTFFENFASGFAVGNPDLDPETSLSWEVGSEWSALDGHLRMSATWFDQSIDDLIQFTSTPSAPGAPNFFNVAEASSRGLELETGGTVGALELGANWTYLDTEVEDAGFASGAGATFVEGEKLLRRPESTLRFDAGMRPRHDLGLSLAVEHVGEREDRDFSTFPASPVTLEAYTLVDAALTWSAPVRLGPDIGVTLRGENLFDDRYEGAFGFEAPGRTLLIDVRVGFGG